MNRSEEDKVDNSRTGVGAGVSGPSDRSSLLSRVSLVCGTSVLTEHCFPSAVTHLSQFCAVGIVILVVWMELKSRHVLFSQGHSWGRREPGLSLPLPYPAFLPASTQLGVLSTLLWSFSSHPCCTNKITRALR